MQAECLACGASGRFWVRKVNRDVYRCDACQLLWVPEGLVVTGGASIYEGDTPIFFQDGNERYYLDETNLLSCREKVAWVRSFLDNGARLLDAGANFGHFLKEAGEVFDAVGIELSRAAVDWSRQHFAVKNHAASIYELPPELKGPYAAATLWDVIEHVPDPRAALAALHDVIEPGGLLFLSTPDAGSRVARLMGPRWHYLDPQQHIVLFDRKNVTRLLEEAGFEVLATRAFGHHYRVGYVTDRLCYLFPNGVLGLGATLGRAMMRPLSARAMYINLGDVMGLVARRR